MPSVTTPIARTVATVDATIRRERRRTWTWLTPRCTPRRQGSGETEFYPAFVDKAAALINAGKPAPLLTREEFLAQTRITGE